MLRVSNALTALVVVAIIGCQQTHTSENDVKTTGEDRAKDEDAAAAKTEEGNANYEAGVDAGFTGSDPTLSDMLPAADSNGSEVHDVDVPDDPIHDGGPSQEEAGATARCDWARLDPTLAAGIREALRLDVDETPTSIQLDEVFSVHTSGTSDLDGVGCLPNLRVLILRRSTVRDLNPLTSCPLFQALVVESPELSDLTPLAMNPELESLGLISTSVMDLSPLLEFSKLTALGLTASDAPMDLSILARLPTMTVLQLEDFPIGDLSPILGPNGLRHLVLINTHVSDLSPLVNWSSPPGKLELLGNPLSDESLTVHIPALLEAGWCIRWTTGLQQELQPRECFPTR